jgi:pimeloyl-ACP methyl ester carboxylesterase
VKLLLLHPLPLDGSVFPEELASLCEIVAPTLYDAGGDLVDWAEAALDHVGDGPISVVGNSIGGSCAIEVARLAPTKVKGLVLSGVKPGHRPEPASRDEALRVLAEHGTSVAWERYWLPLFGPGTPAAVVERGRFAAVRQGPDAIAAGVRAFHSRPDRAGFLDTWTGPVVIVSGEHDINPAASRQLGTSLHAGRFHLVPDVGHYVPLEAPDALHAIVEDLLDTVRRARTSGPTPTRR